MKYSCNTIRPLFCLWVAVVTGLLWTTGCSEAEDSRTVDREAMVASVQQDMSMTAGATGRNELAPAVIRAMLEVPRHIFVPKELQDKAYHNRPLPIGFGQTISQPFIVGLMTDLLDPEPQDHIFEVGTGSGYQAAVLSRIVGRVDSMEIIPELAERAATTLKDLGYGNVTVHSGDGYYGYQAGAPFDGIIVTAAASHVPPPLIRQLKTGGRMVIPVGDPFMTQELLLLTKQPDGGVTTEHILPVRFVPLTGTH